LAQIKWKAKQEYLSEQLEKAKVSKIAKSKLELEKFFLEHPLLFNGKHYNVTKGKRDLLNGALALYNLKLQSGQTPILKWNSTGDKCKEMPVEDGAALAIAIGDYVEPYVAQQQDIELKAKACTTMEELNEVVIKYETTV
jgi:hypothetical protein